MRAALGSNVQARPAFLGRTVVVATSLGPIKRGSVPKPPIRRDGSRAAVVVHALAVWRTLKAAGVPKPTWIPDFGQEERRAVVDRFLGPIEQQVYEELLDDNFRLAEQLRQEAGSGRTYGKSDWIELMCRCVAPAIPDFKWSASTSGEADADGWALVKVKVTGHHRGAPFVLPGLPPVQPSGRRVTLGEQIMRVKVEGGRIKEIVVLPSEGAGPVALYQALGGRVVERA